MRTETPQTPAFEQMVEQRLLERQTRRRLRYLIPVPVTAVRSLRALARGTAHAGAAAAMAVLMVLIWQIPTGDTASVEVGYSSSVPGYVTQYSSSSDKTSPIERARNLGYEVSVRRIFVLDPSADGEILSTTRPGPIQSGSVRGPMLFVIGYSVGSDSANVN